MLTEVNGITTALTIVAYYPSANVNGMPSLTSSSHSSPLLSFMSLSALSSSLCPSPSFPLFSPLLVHPQQTGLHTFAVTMDLASFGLLWYSPVDCISSLFLSFYILLFSPSFSLRPTLVCPLTSPFFFLPFLLSSFFSPQEHTCIFEDQATGSRGTKECK